MNYFPPDFDRFRSKWYGEHLAAMEEPSLFELSRAGATALRFLWLRTFHHPICVRLHRDGVVVQLIGLRLTGQGGYEPGRIDLRVERELESADWRRIEIALEVARFEAPPADPRLGADGAQWIVERARGGDYRMLERWSPDSVGAHADFRAACEMFLALAGSDLVDGDVY